MKKIIAATSAIVELPDVNTLAVVFAENCDGSGVRLEIQRALSFDEQDRNSGQDTYCLCTENGATYYGGITSWEIVEGLLRIQLDSEAARALDVTGGFLVDISPGDSLALNVGLNRILGSPRLHD
jgi:Immunity protein 10